jgi:glycosyltransferase involved in cell wall biosynthesis
MYDAYYFSHGCGVPYERNEHWLQFFDSIAEKITRETQPGSVLDAGCAMGFLVEALRQRDVAAFGVDISEYAIEQVHADIKPYCWVGSVTEPFPQKYDLIVCIEVLEHMTPWDSEQAVINFCRHSDDILFSSTPFDYKEATHFSVRPPEHWAGLFARQGFYRDVDFDASFITPWAVRFQRRRDSQTRIIQDYERKFWLLWKEITDLRSLALDMRNELAATEQYTQQIQEKDSVIQEKDSVIAQSQQMIAHLQQKEREQTQANITLSHHLIIKERNQVELSKVIAEARVLIAQKDQELQKIHRLLGERERANREMSIHLDELEITVIQKNEHIAHLEHLLQQIQSGRVMRVMQTLQVARQQGLRPALALRAAETTPTEPHTTAPVPALPPPRDAYQVWIDAYEPDTQELEQQRHASQTFGYMPLVSIIVPVYNPDAQVLRETIESVLAQTYGRWELYLVDGNSDAPEVKATIAEFTRRDRRIHAEYLDQNRGISGNTNAALELIRGEFLAVLDHDDLLAPNMLYEVVRVLQTQTDADIIYYDEDKVSADGLVRRDPWFKPSAWSPDLLLSTNYFMHSVVRTALFAEVGGFNPAMDGAQDWDLALRLTARTRNIVHIPRVLYHWRQVEGSAARDANAKPWAFAAQARCIGAHLKRLGVAQPRVIFPSLGRVRIIWPTTGAKVSIIIPTRDKVDLLRACLTSILEQTTYRNYEIILVDTGSVEPATHHYYDHLSNDPRIQIVEYAGPFNFSAANNLGVQHAQGDILLFLNNDTEVLITDWLEELVGWVERPEVGVVGCKLIRPDQTIQHAGIIMGVEGHGSHVFDGNYEDSYGMFGSSEWYRNYLAVTGACMILRREVFAELGGFDEVYQVGYSDIELCLAAVSAGYRVVYTPFARLLHHEGGTRGLTLPPGDVLRASVRMLPLIEAGDAFYNPNLSYNQRQPTLVQPGETSRVERLEYILEAFELRKPESNPLPSPVMQNLSAHALHLTQQQGSGFDFDVHFHHDKKLLIVSHDLSLSGAPLILCMLATYLTRHGYSITVLAPENGPLHALYTQANIDVIIEPELLNDARVTYSLLRDYGGVLINTMLAWRCVIAARAFPVPCIWWIHESQFGQQLAQQHRSVAQALVAADAVVTPSHATADRYKQVSHQANILPLHTGLELNGIEPQATMFYTMPDKFYVINIGSIESRKGQDIFLRSIAQLPTEIIQKCEFYLIGRILDWDFYHKLAQVSQPIPNIHIVGEVSPERVAAYLQTADVFVLASRDEALPVAMLEAMHYGKGMVVTNVGGVAEVVKHEVNGLIVNSEDYKGMACALERLFYDRAFLAQIGNHAHATFEEYLTMERFGGAMLQLIRQFFTPTDQPELPENAENLSIGEEHHVS